MAMNPSVLAHDHAEADLSPDQITALHKAEWEREKATIAEQIMKLRNKEAKLKADNTLNETVAAIAEAEQAYDALDQRGPI